MVIKLALPRHLPYLLETEVILIRPFKRKHHVDKVLAQLCYPRNAFMRVGDADHCFSRLDSNITYLFKFVDKMMEKQQRMWRFTG